MTSVYAKEMHFHFIYFQGICVVILMNKREDGENYSMSSFTIRVCR